MSKNKTSRTETKRITFGKKKKGKFKKNINKHDGSEKNYRGQGR